MRTENEIVDEIVRQFKTISYKYMEDNNLLVSENDIPSLVVATERMFMFNEDKRKMICRNDNQDIELGDMKYNNTLFVVISLTSGQHNFALSQNQVTFQVLSENGSLTLAENLLRNYLNIVNFETINGMIQTYTNPDVAEGSVQIFEGMRALVTMRGIVLLSNEDTGTAYVTHIKFNIPGESEWYQLPFITYAFSETQSGEPQAFPFETYDGNIIHSEDKGGWTSTKNRQSTLTVSIATYLAKWDNFAYTTNEKARGLQRFSDFIVEKIIKRHDFNKVIHFKFLTNAGLSKQTSQVSSESPEGITIDYAATTATIIMNDPTHTLTKILEVAAVVDDKVIPFQEGTYTVDGNVITFYDIEEIPELQITYEYAYTDKDGDNKLSIVDNYFVPNAESQQGQWGQIPLFNCVFSETHEKI